MVTLYPLSWKKKVVFYLNLCAGSLWFFCFIRFVVLLYLVGTDFLPEGIADFFHVVSCLSLIVFSCQHLLMEKNYKATDGWSMLNGLRMILICYWVITFHPKVTTHRSYSVLIFSWAITYIVHFSYYALKTKTGRYARLLFWLEFNLFHVTFFVSSIAEMVLIFLSTGVAENGSIDIYCLQALLLTYIPTGFFYWRVLKKRREQKFLPIYNKLWPSVGRENVAYEEQADTSQSQTRSKDYIELRQISTIHSEGQS